MAGYSACQPPRLRRLPQLHHSPRPHPPGQAGRQASEWQRILQSGVRLTDIDKRFRFDLERRAWWGWQGTHWREIIDLTAIIDRMSIDRMRLAADLMEKGRHDLASLLVAKWESSSGKGHGDFWSSLRLELGRATPAPPDHELATPGRVVDLRTGRIAPHDPLIHDTLAVTAGGYRPDDAAKLRALLFEGRLRHNVTPEDFDSLIKLIGLALTGKATDHRSLVWLYGVEGGGKGMTSLLILGAFARYAWSVTLDMLERRYGDIDNGMADLLSASPRIIVCDELGGGGIKLRRLLTLTGDGEYQARRAHGKTIRRSLKAMWFAPTVDPPTLPVTSGLNRRSVAIAFDNQYPFDAPRSGDFSQDEFDALVTLAIIEARHVYRLGSEYRGPQGNVEKRGELLATMDDLATWLQELGDEYHDVLHKEVRELATSDLGKNVTGNAMGRVLRNSARWYSQRKGKGGQYKIYRYPESMLDEGRGPEGVA